MLSNSITPDLSKLEIPIDPWTQPFWDASAKNQLLLPSCSSCTRFRWPPGPFCPHCQSQSVTWTEPGIARIYSFTVVPEPPANQGEPPRQRVPALIEFPEANGIRLFGAIVDTPLTNIHIGAELTVGWSQAMNATVPVFRIAR